MEAGKKSGAEEPSMEEILQSIKKIISEDDPSAKAADAPKTNGNGAHAEVPGSDVLELTEALPEEAPAPAQVAAVAKPEAVSTPPTSNDVLSKIDEALAVSTPAAPAAAPSADGLLSDQASNAAMSAFKKLQTAAEPPIPEVHTTHPQHLAQANLWK